MSRVSVDRRSFLRATLRATVGLGPALVTLATLPAAACAGGCSRDERSRGTGFLRANERRVLEAVAEALVGAHAHDELPSVVEAGVVDFLDDLLPRLPAEVQAKLPLLLAAVEHGPRLLGVSWRRFSELPRDVRERYLRGWASSRFRLRRLGFRALKNLVMLGYYQADATWPAIGYGGPWIGGGGVGTEPGAHNAGADGTHDPHGAQTVAPAPEPAP